MKKWPKSERLGPAPFFALIDKDISSNENNEAEQRAYRDAEPSAVQFRKRSGDHLFSRCWHLL